MAILAQCPICRKKQSVKNKLCICGENLDKAKKSNRVNYWISYRLPGGKQRREQVGYSIEEARNAEGKRRSQKREGSLFDIKPDTKMTFNELSKWYLGLEKVKAHASCWREEISLKKFNSIFGDMIVNKIKPADLENYQAMRRKEGLADNTIDHEIGTAKTMINKAFDNDIVSGETFRTFKKVKKLLRRNTNARKKILTIEQFNRLMDYLPKHTREILVTGFYTGMRLGEILNLTWDRVDLKMRVIRLEATDTKDREPRNIPIYDKLYKVFTNELGYIRKVQDDNHVFLYEGKPIKSIRKDLMEACKKADIIYGRFIKDGFIFHDLRHTFNTNMRKAGVAESVIMEITGHSTREMFDRYNTIDEEDTRNAVDQLQVFLGNVDQTLTNEIENKGTNKKEGI